MRNSNWIFILLTSSLIAAKTFAGEPLNPDDATRPQTHQVGLNESTTIRMGDTVMLKDTRFSAKLVGFTEPPTCLPPGPGCKSDGPPRPDFQFVEGDVTCESNPKPKSPSARRRIKQECAGKLHYAVIASPVENRAAVKVHIEEKKPRR